MEQMEDSIGSDGPEEEISKVRDGDIGVRQSLGDLFQFYQD